ncbi:MAG TPA: DUF4386 domain-containing protein [Propionibacteriaceae bacterium]|nr:DUF4386 domain-containing protein [Propionibacteriaceae bacterium]HPZ49017.1 DUF4386 domain-containing protein [Propionibacteriaceae bacterium]HQE32029.1 DUF4386 domain-containing protein [Propionibacteriaceae bacterium]
MSNPRALARVASLLYLVTWVTSVAAVPLYGGSGFAAGQPLAGRTSVLAAAALEVVLAVSVVGTALVLFPLLRPHGHAAALGYVALRTLESTVILVGVVAILPAVARPATTAAPGVSGDVVAALHLLHDWTFLVGPGLINPVNATVLAVLLLRQRLVPTFIPILGLVGAALVCSMNLAIGFGVTGPIGPLVVPLFAWELSLAGYLLVRGIGPRPVSQAINHAAA